MRGIEPAKALLRALLGFSLALSVWLICPVARAQLEVPQITARVMDGASFLSPAGQQKLEQELARYEQQTGHQFVLLTIESLQGETIEEFGIRVGDQWKLGDAQRDDGLIMVLAKAERKMRIEVGYGLEGVVPDAVASRVIRDTLTPAFRRGDFEVGIFAAFDVLMKRASGEAVQPEAPRAEEAGRGVSVLALLFWLIVFGIGIRSRSGGALLAGMLIGGLGGGRGRGGGFGGGGGFRGGRGGGFGGGGASGGW